MDGREFPAAQLGPATELVIIGPEAKREKPVPRLQDL